MTTKKPYYVYTMTILFVFYFAFSFSAARVPDLVVKQNK